MALFFHRKQEASGASPLKRLIHYGQEWKFSAVKASCYSVANKIFDIFPEILIGVAVDLVVKREESFLARIGVAEPLQQLLYLGALTGIIWLCESAFEYLYSVEWRNLAQGLQHRLRLDVYQHVQKLDLSWFAQKSTGDVLSIINDDINQLERFLDSGVNEIIQVFVSSIVVSAIFFYLSPSIALFAMLPIPIILVGSFVFQKKLHGRYVKVRHAAGALGAKISNNLQGIATIKSYTTESFELASLSELSQHYREVNQQAIRMSSVIVPVIRMAILLGFVVTLVLGGWLTLQGQLAVGSYSVLIFLTQRLLWPFTRLGQTFDLYQRAMASTHRILSLLETPITIKEPLKPLEGFKAKGGISFHDVSFAYEGYKPLFKGMSVDIKQGEYIGIVGATGSGKSTLVKLLLRFYEPTGGTICLDGVPITGITLQDLRQSIALVSQDTFLFDGTIRENIAYGAGEVSEAELKRIAKLAEVDAFIESLPMAYETQIGERGIRLSGGQRQRISIARALLKSPPILVFDEATSAVDNETEAAIQRSLAKLKHTRTMLVIAHRLSTVRHADRIFVLGEQGIAEQGTHEELLAKGGLYDKLWKIQTGGGFEGTLAT